MPNANAGSTSDYDHLIIGGAVAGAATALLLLRRDPALRIAIVEKSEVFKRRVGESTVEISAAFLGRELGLTSHLNREHLVKQGLRFFFAGEGVERLEDCGELGSLYNVRLPGYQLDRSVLDQEVLRRAEAAGATVLRPAKVRDFTLQPGGLQEVVVETPEGARRTLRARWLIDASGLASVVGRKLGLIERNRRHPISSVWARFRGVVDWDAIAESRPARWRSRVFAIRDTATNHLLGKGYWIWVIPLRSGEYSIGVVYDQRLVQFPTEGGSLGDRLRAFVERHPAGREILRGAEWVEGDVLARSDLPYRAKAMMGDGWALVGDAAAFLDPFYSPGLDFVAYSTSATAAILGGGLEGSALQAAIDRHNKLFALSYERWFTALYEDKYYYSGDLELLDLGFRLDLAGYYLGVVARPLLGYADGWTLPPFAHANAGPAHWLVRSYNRSLARIGKRRMASGRFGQGNARVFRPFNSFEFNYKLPLRFLGLLLRWRWLVAKEWVIETFGRSRRSTTAQTAAEAEPATPARGA